jgi:hypothetical protein
MVDARKILWRFLVNVRLPGTRLHCDSAVVKESPSVRQESQEIFYRRALMQTASEQSPLQQFATTTDAIE